LTFKRYIIFIYLIFFSFTAANNKLAIDGSGRYLSSIFNNKEILVWDIKNSALLFNSRLECDTISDLAIYHYYNDTTILSTVASCSNGLLFFLNKEGKIINKKHYPEYGSEITTNNTMAFSNNGEILYTIGKDSIGFVVDPYNGQLKNIIEGSNYSMPKETIVSPNNRYLITSYLNGSLKFWTIDSQWENLNSNFLMNLSKARITGLSLASNKHLLVSDNKKYIYLVDYVKKKILKKKKIITNGYANQIVFNREGTGFFTGHKNGKISYWRIAGTDIHFHDKSKKKHNGLIQSMLLYPKKETNLIITAGTDNFIHFIDFNEYEIECSFYINSNGWISFNDKSHYKGTLKLSEVPIILKEGKKMNNPFKHTFNHLR
jgi:WD40 repeat protein